MLAEQVIDILEEVNEALQDPNPAVSKNGFVPELLAEVAPFVNAAGKDAHASYIAAKQRLVSNMQPLIDPRTGAELP